MTYDLTIGELWEETETDNGEAVLLRGAKSMKHDDAPAFPGSIVSRNANEISIPWGGYGAFERAVRMFDATLCDLLCRGTNDWEIVPITGDLLSRIDAVLSEFKATFPQATPSFSGDSENNWTLARLEILAWWTHYAHEHFGDKAVIHIS